MSSSRENNRWLFNKVIFVYLILFVPYLIVISLFYSIIYSDNPLGIPFLIFLIVYPGLTTMSCNRVLASLYEFKLQFFILLISRILILTVFIIAVFFLKNSLFTQLFILLSGTMLYFSLLIFFVRKEGIMISLRFFPAKDIIKLLKVSFPLGLAVIFGMLYDKIDLILISRLTDFTQTAYYNIGYGVFKASSLMFSFLFLAGLTKISYLSRRKSAVRIFFYKYSFLLIIITLLITVFLLAGAGFIINVLFTSKYDNSIIVLRILSFGITGLALNHLTGIILNGVSMYKENMKVTFWGLLLNVVLNLIFIPYYGILASCVISVLTEYFIFFGDLYFLKDLLRKNNL